MQELRFNHGLYYPDNHDIPLADIAATLIAHERLLPIVTDAMERLVPGLSIDDRKILLQSIERASLNEAFFVALFVAYQKDLEKQVPALIETATGIHVSDRYDSIVTVLFLIALYYGAQAIFGRGRKSGAKDNPVPVSITGDYATYVNIAAEQLGTSPDNVTAAFEKAIGKTKLATVQRAAVDLFRPAKRGGNGRILPRNAPPISAKTVADFPDAIALAELDDDSVPVHLPRATLHIRATDRDKTDKGWARQFFWAWAWRTPAMRWVMARSASERAMALPIPKSPRKPAAERQSRFAVSAIWAWTCSARISSSRRSLHVIAAASADVKVVAIG